MATPTLIYCADGNKRFAEIAIDAGFRYGARLPPRGCHFPVYFADQDWKRPDRERYMAELEKHRPAMATVLDWEREEQLPEVLAWAEDAAQYVDQVLIIPKVIGGIQRLSRVVGGAEVILAYSVPTRFGGTFVPAWEFAGWPVHLLGGSPHRQMGLMYYLNVVSVDGNMMNKMATKRCQVWVAGTARYARDRYWPTLIEMDGKRWGQDAPYEAFRRSCQNIMRAWRDFRGHNASYGANGRIYE